MWLCAAAVRRCGLCTGGERTWKSWLCYVRVSDAQRGTFEQVASSAGRCTCCSSKKMTLHFSTSSRSFDVIPTMARPRARAPARPRDARVRAPGCPYGARALWSARARVLCGPLAGPGWCQWWRRCELCLELHAWARLGARVGPRRPWRLTSKDACRLVYEQVPWTPSFGARLTMGHRTNGSR